MKISKAFTLAEVLITLGIIGVVATMTMSVLYGKYQNYVLKKRFAKSYSLINNTLNYIYEANGLSVPECYRINSSNLASTDCDWVKEEFLKKLNIIKTCPNKAFENGCIAEYTSDFVMPTYEKLYSKDKINNSIPAYVLNDGTIILGADNTKFPTVISIDLNGKKGPNKFGYDIFTFHLYYKDNKWYFNASNGAVENGGKTSAEMLRELNLSD